MQEMVCGAFYDGTFNRTPKYKGFSQINQKIQSLRQWGLLLLFTQYCSDQSLALDVAVLCDSDAVLFFERASDALSKQLGFAIQQF
ncbi:hypothetical protein PVK06_002910 [Gossypium arboreum]|uniref:Uncharacterized protein n=1 Tax=Gossypium arboreum TaxID=29729 RepID=A0ABR0R526_GOSAR|nr:hypothetical protein PVK06_002910 [Gossypium arboreum]